MKTTKTEEEVKAEFERIDREKSLQKLIWEFRAKSKRPWIYFYDAAIEFMRAKGFAVRIDNGLDGTWEATFYKPSPSLAGIEPDDFGMFQASGDTMGIAVLRSALKVIFLEEKR